MNVYSITLGHARPELERSILFFFYADVKRMGQYKSFDKIVASLASKERNNYFIKSVVREPFPIRRFK